MLKLCLFSAAGLGWYQTKLAAVFLMMSILLVLNILQLLSQPWSVICATCCSLLYADLIYTENSGVDISTNKLCQLPSRCSCSVWRKQHQRHLGQFCTSPNHGGTTCLDRSKFLPRKRHHKLHKLILLYKLHLRRNIRRGAQSQEGDTRLLRRSSMWSVRRSYTASQQVTKRNRWVECLARAFRSYTSKRKKLDCREG